MVLPLARTPLVWLVALAFFPMSGCLGSSPRAPAADAPSERADSQEGATLEGQVFGTAHLPLPDAEVELLGASTTVVTDLSGTYRFVDLPPGNYEVQASKNGHASEVQRAFVLDGAVTIVDFTLFDLSLPYYTAAPPFNGFISCSLWWPPGGDTPRCGDVDANHNPAREFALEPRAVQIQAQAYWTPATVLAKTLTMTVESVRPGTQPVLLGHASGESGLKVVISPDELREGLDEGARVRVSMTAGPTLAAGVSGAELGVAFQQAFHLDVAVFYNRPGPEDFTLA